MTGVRSSINNTPRSPDASNIMQPSMPADLSPNRDREIEGGPATIEGGSFLCAEDFCGRFRPSARQPRERDLTTNHVGFRTIARVDGPETN